jgi:intracellular septation protein A
MASRLAAAWGAVRNNGLGYGLEICVNGVLPVVIYQLTDKQLGDVRALIASSVPPILWGIFQFIRARRIDALSLLIITGIALSLLALLGGGGAKFLQLRENLVTGVIGLIFLVSALIGRPVIYYVALATMNRRNPGGEAAEFRNLRGNVYFERVMKVMTLVWGAGMLGRTVVAVVLVFSVSIPTFLAINPVLGYATTFPLIGWTAWYGRRQQRLGAARRAAAEAAAAEAAEVAAPAPVPVA